MLNLITGPVTINCNSSYDTEVTTHGSIIQSPNYPSSYEPGKNCRITIRFSDRILLRFLDFDVEACSDSCCDYLIVFDGPVAEYTSWDDLNDPRQMGKKLCGYTNPGKMVSSGTTMHLLFQTDSTQQRNGFRIQALETGKLLINFQTL